MSDPTPYRTPQWRALRAAILWRDPICRACRMKPSLHVDHIKAHRGDHGLFWDPGNLQGLCHGCHSHKSTIQDGGFGIRRNPDAVLKGTAPDGFPTSANHHWNKPR